jgi:hypothetical protein
MAPFDLSYSGDELLRGAGVPHRLATRHQIADTSRVAPRTAQLPQAAENLSASPAARTYVLVDARHSLQGQPVVAAPPDAEGMRTYSYTEYLLQVLDKNSTMSSILFIICYAGLLHIL